MATTVEYSIEKIRDLYPLKKEELQKNIELKKRLIETKNEIEDEQTYNKYFNAYSNKIERLAEEVAAFEQDIANIRSEFARKKLDINDEIYKLEKVIKDTNTLHQSGSIDNEEYKRRKKENDLNLAIIEQENKSLHTKEHQFESLLFLQKSGRATQAKNRDLRDKQDASSRSTKPSKPLVIGLVAGLAVVIVVLLVVFSNSGYFGGNSESMSSAYQKVYPTRVPVVDNSTSYGFTDERGIIIIEPQFDDVRNFSEGYAAVKQKGAWGYIDTDGNIVIDCQYTLQYTSAFSEGLVRVSKDGKYGFIDASNNTVIPFEYAFAREFKLGLAPVKMGDKWGYIDTNNNVIVDFVYENAYTFREDGLAIVRIDGAEGFINTSGEYVIEPLYDSVKAYIGGLAAARKNGLWGYMDTNENFVIPNKYRNAYNFADNYAVVEGSGSFGVVDKLGNILLNIEDYKKVSNLGSGMFTATDDDRLWQLFDVKGDMKIDNKITISSINMYGNGAIFRVKTPYGYSLYDYSFSLVMNYYFPYTGMYKYHHIDEKTNLESEYYFFIWYKEDTRRHYAFCIYTDGHVEENFVDLSAISIRNGSFIVQKEVVSTNSTEIYSIFYNDYTYQQEIVTNTSTLNFTIDKDVLSLGSTNFNKVYTIENGDMFENVYFDEITLY